MLKAIFVVLLFANPVIAQDQATAARIEAGCGPSKVQFDVRADKNQHPTGELEAGKALVYVFGDESRDANVSYLGRTPIRVGVDGVWVGANIYRTYHFFAVAPGDHRMCAAWQGIFESKYKAAVAAGFTAEAGKVYYFRTIAEKRLKRTPAVTLEQIDSAEGQLLISNSALSTSRAKK